MDFEISRFRLLGLLAALSLVFPSGFAQTETADDETTGSLNRNMTSNKTLYLANPYGFSAQQREGPLQETCRGS